MNKNEDENKFNSKISDIKYKQKSNAFFIMIGFSTIIFFSIIIWLFFLISNVFNFNKKKQFEENNIFSIYYAQEKSKEDQKVNKHNQEGSGLLNFFKPKEKKDLSLEKSLEEEKTTQSLINKNNKSNKFVNSKSDFSNLNHSNTGDSNSSDSSSYNVNGYTSPNPSNLNANGFNGSNPSSSNANGFNGSNPSSSNANGFNGSNPSSSNANGFNGSNPSSSNANGSDDLNYIQNIEEKQSSNFININSEILNKSGSNMIIKLNESTKSKEVVKDFTRKKIDTNSLISSSTEKNSTKKISISKKDNFFLLERGKQIHCTLKNRIVSTIAGSISCIVNDDIYNSKGQVVLIEKGSVIDGNYKSGQINLDKRRMYVIWETISTTNYIKIPINADAVTNLGSAGIEGYVDDHWMKKFGSAMALSLISDGVNVATDSVNKTIDLSDLTMIKKSNELIEQVLRQYINIESTMHKNHGDSITVYINTDIDLSNVYGVKLND